MFRKIAWTALVTLASSLAAGLALRASGGLWRALLQEEPPAAPGWAKFVFGRLYGRQVKGALRNVPASAS